MKLLYILNETNRVNNFSFSSMKAAQELGIEFSIAGNWSYSSEEERHSDELRYGIKIYQVDFIRSPFSLGNRKAFRQLEEIMNEENFDIIHCNTPIGGVAGRLLGNKKDVKLIIYQAHGFHFYSSAPAINWLLFYPAEKYLARYTDTLITINSEDYERGKSFRLRNNGNIYYVPGVGIDIDKFASPASDDAYFRKEYGIPDNAIVVLMVGELNKNKNVSTVIRAIGRLKRDDVHLVLCGMGPEEEKLRSLSVATGLDGKIHFAGFRKEIKQILRESDIYVMASYREGLSRSIMEAMASGKPCIVSDIRGNRDLIKQGKGGFLCAPCDEEAFAQAIESLAENDLQQQTMGEYNRNAVADFSTSRVISDIKEIYKKEIARVLR